MKKPAELSNEELLRRVRNASVLTGETLGELCTRFEKLLAYVPAVVPTKEEREVEYPCLSCPTIDCPCDADAKEKLKRKSDG